MGETKASLLPNLSFPSWSCHPRALQPGVSPGYTRAALPSQVTPTPLSLSAGSPFPSQLQWVPVPQLAPGQHAAFPAECSSCFMFSVGCWHLKTCEEQAWPCEEGRAAFPQALCQYSSESQQPSTQQALRSSGGRGSFALSWMCHSQPTQILSPLPAGEAGVPSF